MILADKIIELRKKSGWSQEELADRLEVSRQAVSKWEGAQSVPDMNKILKLSEVFGVTTDYLLKDDMETQETSLQAADSDSAIRPVSMEEASEFLDFRDTMAARVSIGVMLCILSPVALILLAGANEFGLIQIGEARVVAMGLVILFLLVGTAVALFVLTGIQNRFEYMEQEPIDTAYGVSGMARERREKYKGTFTVHLTMGIVLCVVAVIPLFLAMLLYGEKDNFIGVIAVTVMLALIAVGVFFIVRSAILWGGLQMLLEEGDYTRRRKEEEKKNAPIAAIYWGVVTAGYLAYSFVTARWEISWIVWPVAGVLYGALAGILNVVRSRG